MRKSLDFSDRKRISALTSILATKMIDLGVK
jgi:hypothetical protein